MAPTVYLGMRQPRTTYLYEDPDRPERVTGYVQSPPFTDVDQALLLGFAEYEESLCPGCKTPIAEAWHSETDGWWDANQYVCHPCTARARADDQPGRESKPVAYTFVHSTLPAGRVLPPFVLGVTTSST